MLYHKLFRKIFTPLQQGSIFLWTYYWYIFQFSIIKKKIMNFSEKNG